MNKEINIRKFKMEKFSIKTFKLKILRNEKLQKSIYQNIGKSQSQKNLIS
jgi:hypothetical protein